MRLNSLWALIALAPSLVAAAQPVRLLPSSQWDVDYSANSCRLVRTFGEGKTLTKLAFESAAPGQMDLLVFGRPLQSSQTSVVARFLPVGTQVEGGSPSQTTDEKVPAILWDTVPLLPEDARKQQEERSKFETRGGVRPPPVSLAEQATLKQQRQAFAAAMKEIEIDSRRSQPVVLETGSMAEAVAAFDKCSHDSLKDWGVDPELEDKIVRPVWATNPNEWLFAGDYPEEMARRGEISQVAVRLLIDPSGKITSCTPLSHYAEAEFNRVTCASITKRAHFEPAELADGTKVPSYYTRRIVFRLED